MRVTVIGASGRIGERIIREGVLRGHEVMAVVRDPATFDDSGFGGRVALADVFDPAAVAAGVADCDVVVSAVGHAASSDDRGYYVRAARSLVEALRSLGAGGPRLLVVGGFGSLERTPGTQFADAGGYRVGRDRVEGEPRANVVSMEDFAVAVIDEAERAEHVFVCICVAN